MFETLPRVFDQMGGGMSCRCAVLCAGIFGSPDQFHFYYGSYRFFFMDKFKMTRLKSLYHYNCYLYSSLEYLHLSETEHGRILSRLAWTFLTFFDYMSKNVIMPIGSAVHLSVNRLVCWMGDNKRNYKKW